MISSSSTETSCSESEYDDADDNEGGLDQDSSVRTYENPNYRKLYAALNMTVMMGEKQHLVDKDGHEKSGCEGERQEPEGSEENGQNVSCNEQLPSGWEEHEDDKGAYYWHIPSGTIQRDKPKTISTQDQRRDSLIYLKEEDDQKSVQVKEKIDDASVPTFIVHSLGWMYFDELELTPATSSKAIQKCIMELTSRGDNNAVRCWGHNETQELVFKIQESHIKLYDKSGQALLTSQPISGIRVWGVNDNNDFAYVAKDAQSSPSLSSPSASAQTSSSTYKCHVFHCDCEDSNVDAAQSIATILKDEMIEMKLKSEQWQYSCSASASPSQSSHQQRPKHLFIYDSNTPSTLSTPTAIEFPTPIEEPRKTLIAKYLGKISVAKPMGIDVLNQAILNIIKSNNERDESEDVSERSSLIDISNIIVLVHVSPSSIILESNSTGCSVLECRVRYLSFLGISNYNVKNCGFIMQTGERQFEAHCFECEPSAGALCKTIEAACKLRYQKCLDAHQQRLENRGDNKDSSSSSNNQSKIKSTIRSVFSKFIR